MPLTNIATLDAIATHFTRLIELTSADEAFVHALAQSLASAILRPRVESSLTQGERHAYRLVRDLFAYKDQIFGALKKASSVGARPRAISTDESQRRAHVEARNRAVIGAAKSRSSSPAPPARHGRVTSSEVTRFPINTSPTSSSPRSSRGYKQRDSLEVPGAEPTPSLDTETVHSPPPHEDSAPDSGANSPLTSAVVHEVAAQGGLEKKNSLSRSGHAASSRFPRRGANLTRGGKRDSLASYADGENHEEQPSRGVELVDRPMGY